MLQDDNQMESPLEAQNYAADVTDKSKVSNFRLQMEDLAFGSVGFYKRQIYTPEKD